jgi:saccharopine dehydrogenase (NADP+, L-glutamate forming)
MKKILVLGAGMVAPALTRYLLDQPELHVTMATRTVSKAQTIVSGHPRSTAVPLDVSQDGSIEALIKECDLAISLLPYVYHPKVAELCVRHKKDMVTTSYVKEAMQALDQPARDAGVILMNEIGVDPGIDHMSAMQVIHRVERSGGTVTSFKSWCGGLPAPEANDNPLGYKFSWSPKGVILASKNHARFQRGGEIIEIPGQELFDHYWSVHIEGLGEFEGYPNRDAMPYADIYSIEPTDWMFRGTLRNSGWCATLKKIGALGLLDETPLDPVPATYRQLTAHLLDADPDADFRQLLSERWGLSADDKPIADLKWLGFFSSDSIPDGLDTPLDILAARMLDKMAYQPGERDMLIMQHEFVAEYPDRQEEITSTMIDFGIPDGDSSMARTVGLPAAIATRMILQGEITLTGVQVPVVPEIYEPVLAELQRLGIGLAETVRVID